MPYQILYLAALFLALFLLYIVGATWNRYDPTDPKEVTIICCQCKRHISGPAPEPGRMDSHGYCPECAAKIIQSAKLEHTAELSETTNTRS